MSTSGSLMVRQDSLQYIILVIVIYNNIDIAVQCIYCPPPVWRMASVLLSLEAPLMG